MITKQIEPTQQGISLCGKAMARNQVGGHEQDSSKNQWGSPMGTQSRGPIQLEVVRSANLIGQ
jgi:hypothetical protein